MRKQQKNGLLRVKLNSDRQKQSMHYKRAHRKDLLSAWQNPMNFKTHGTAKVLFRGYKTPAQIKSRWLKMKNKKVKQKESILSSLWS